MNELTDTLAKRIYRDPHRSKESERAISCLLYTSLYEPSAGETVNKVLIPFTCSIFTPLSNRAFAWAAKYFFSASASAVEMTIGSATLHLDASATINA